MLFTFQATPMTKKQQIIIQSTLSATYCRSQLLLLKTFYICKNEYISHICITQILPFLQSDLTDRVRHVRSSLSPLFLSLSLQACLMDTPAHFSSNIYDIPTSVYDSLSHLYADDQSFTPPTLHQKQLINSFGIVSMGSTRSLTDCTNK